MNQLWGYLQITELHAALPERQCCDPLCAEAIYIFLSHHCKRQIAGQDD